MIAKPFFGDHGGASRTLGYTAQVESARRLVSVDDYLTAELDSPVKHEYVGGVVYAMAGGRNTHNLIAGNIFACLHVRLRGSACRPYNSDTKIRLRLPSHVRFYYPDLSVVCRPNPGRDAFQDEPAVIVEVLSRRTRRQDEGEKKDAYLQIPSLTHYLLVEPDEPLVVAYRRTDLGFLRETWEGLEAVVPMVDLGIELPLAEAYEGVTYDAEDEET